MHKILLIFKRDGAGYYIPLTTGTFNIGDVLTILDEYFFII